MEAKKKYRIVVLEPSPVVTAGIKALLSPQPELEIVHCFADVLHYQERAAALRPDILLINPCLIDFSKRQHLRTLFAEPQDLLLFALLYHYADADTLKQYNGVIEINDDASAIVRKLKQAVENNTVQVETGEGYELSERETEILAAVAKGLTNKEIADMHNISIHTVISHRKNITRKTGIKTVSGLTVYALLNNLIEQSDVE